MPPPVPPRYDTPEALAALGQSFQQSRVLLTAFELGVFSALAEGPKTSAALAAALATDPRATDRLLNALCALGLVTKSGQSFANSEAAQKYLVRGRPEYLSRLGHSANLYGRWAELTAAVRAGRRVSERRRDPEETAAFIEAMHYRGQRDAEELVARLDLSGVTRVLDVGGGSGAYAMAFCRARPGIAAEVLDLPEVVPLTRRYVEAAGLSGCVTARPGNYLSDGFGEGFDLVFFSAIVHINPPDENLLLMRKAAAALNPGGRVVVQDFVMNDARTQPPFGAFFALNMLVNTEGGDTYTEAEIRTWLRKAGCPGVARIETGPHTAMIVGRKPAPGEMLRDEPDIGD
jgi:SAM-dependent methyltransferase